MSTAELAQATQQAHTLTPRFLEDVRVATSTLLNFYNHHREGLLAHQWTVEEDAYGKAAKSTDPVPAAETKSKSKTKSGRRKPKAGSSAQPQSEVTPNDTAAPVQSKKRKGDSIEARPKKTRVMSAEFINSSSDEETLKPKSESLRPVGGEAKAVKPKSQPHFSHMTPSAGLSLIQRPKLDPNAGPPKTAMAALRQAKTAEHLANQNAMIAKGNYQLTTIPCKTTCTYAVTKKKDTDSEVEDEIQKGLQDLETATVSGGDAQVKIVRKKARSKKPQVKKVKLDVKEKGKQDVEMATVGHDAEHVIDMDMEVGLTMGKGKSEGGIDIEMAEVKHEETEVSAIPKADKDVGQVTPTIIIEPPTPHTSAIFKSTETEVSTNTDKGKGWEIGPPASEMEWIVPELTMWPELGLAVNYMQQSFTPPPVECMSWPEVSVMESSTPTMREYSAFVVQKQDIDASALLPPVVDSPVTLSQRLLVLKEITRFIQDQDLTSRPLSEKIASLETSVWFQKEKITRATRRMDHIEESAHMCWKETQEDLQSIRSDHQRLEAEVREAVKTLENKWETTPAALQESLTQGFEKLTSRIKTAKVTLHDLTKSVTTILELNLWLGAHQSSLESLIIQFLGNKEKKHTGINTDHSVLPDRGQKTQQAQVSLTPGIVLPNPVPTDHAQVSLTPAVILPPASESPAVLLLAPNPIPPTWASSPGPYIGGNRKSPWLQKLEAILQTPAQTECGCLSQTRSNMASWEVMDPVNCMTEYWTMTGKEKPR
ncbi:uncharacterized protein LACBIDRAFT_334155 [Laccaria bicolor S238N-H82]|uniref:Uncharacterized protein n=1 Tax=Laccaria bicolor (strain S238N-H82 / ATCC MYA-4686) TaxID=486041 RepID=B0DY93_LACBS|nr:uncharacterized protein LACBIDRAFT_334155 [Laccaria bicolor S238N-H82]EDR00394.1 hypothetical protein LACBIDRAFT_334155 [Laccaria bicolor S238N-H82]|eukprot:XP_001888953.1 hypothetical protein LACBIDRAFT_334155 [Laccaria bicolor S238N-H82]